MTKQSFETIVDTLLDAYNNDELFHGHCNACAVGNICMGNDAWKMSIGMYGYRERPAMPNLPLPPTVAPVTKEELIAIEDAFEGAIDNSEEGYEYYAPIYCKEDVEYYRRPEASSRQRKEVKRTKQGQYMGLVAVIEVMKGMVEDAALCTTSKDDARERLDVIATKFGVTV